MHSQARNGIVRRGIGMIAVGVLALGGAGSLAACSSGGSAEPTSTPTSTEQQSGNQVIGPVIVEPGQTAVSVTLGRMVVFDVADPTAEMIATDNPEILNVIPGRDDGSAVFNPGAETLTTGTATVTLTNMDTGATQVVSVTVTE